MFTIRRAVAALCLTLTIPAISPAQTTWYVDRRATGTASGQSWTNAFTHLHAAFLNAVSGDTIRIAAGTYTPDIGHPTLPPGDRGAYWSYVGGVQVRGGYRGLGAGGAPDDRNTTAFATILSGEIGNASLLTDNSRTLMNANVSGAILLDGLTFTATYQDDSSVNLPQGHYGSALWTFGSLTATLNDLKFVSNTTINNNQVGRGGAVFIYNTPGTMSNCQFLNNHIGGAQFQTVAAGLFIWQSNLSISNCTFDGNVNDASAGAAYAGALYIEHGLPILTNVIFRNNSALSGGGAVFHRNAWAPPPSSLSGRIGAPTFVGCRFENNSANQGGAAFIWSRRPDDTCRFTNCVFLGNAAAQNGGAIYSNGGGDTIMSVRVEGCLFTTNRTGPGFVMSGAAFDGPGTQTTLVNCTLAGNLVGRALSLSAYPNTGPFAIQNCILRANGSGSLDPFSSLGTISNSDIEGAAGLNSQISRTNVIDADPGFVGLPSGDFHLVPGSPCINTGANSAVPPTLTVDLDANARIAAGIVDMGAYEMPPGACSRPGDVNGDGVVDAGDIQGFVGCLISGSGGNCTCADVNGVNGVTAADAAALTALLLSQ